MVDRTEELKSFFDLDSKQLETSKSHSQFILNSSEILIQIHKMEEVVKNSFLNYTGLHQHIKTIDSNIMSLSEKSAFDQSLSLFIASCASTIHEFRIPKNVIGSNFDHHKEVINYLLNVKINLN
jgi:hypothetical protein